MRLVYAKIFLCQKHCKHHIQNAKANASKKVNYANSCFLLTQAYYSHYYAEYGKKPRAYNNLERRTVRRFFYVLVFAAADSAAAICTYRRLKSMEKAIFRLSWKDGFLNIMPQNSQNAENKANNE